MSTKSVITFSARNQSLSYQTFKIQQCRQRQFSCTGQKGIDDDGAKALIEPGGVEIERKKSDGGGGLYNLSLGRHRTVRTRSNPVSVLFMNQVTVTLW